jgi:hypothetical protein
MTTKIARPDYCRIGKTSEKKGKNAAVQVNKPVIA